MKLRYALLIALALMFSAGLAKAGPVDPTVIIDDPPTPPNCQQVTCFSGNTIVLDLLNGFLPKTGFAYTGSSTLTTLFVVLDDVLPGEVFTCSSNIFLGPCKIGNTQGANDDDQGQEIDDDEDSIEISFTGGSLKTNDGITAQVSPTPEPGTMVLLLSGVLPLFLIGRKRWGTDHSV
ncbi:MAG: PEP-CTERM sorting domain-containing protein [Candidatus Acidiferrales bacterium]